MFLYVKYLIVTVIFRLELSLPPFYTNSLVTLQERLLPPVEEIHRHNSNQAKIQIYLSSKDSTDSTLPRFSKVILETQLII